MSFQDGWAALNLEMPARVPRTEYSLAEYHFPLIRHVLGLDVDENSSPEQKKAARLALRQAWSFDFNWSTLIHNQVFGALQTRMGHAVYAGNSGDFDTRRSSPFADPEAVLAFDPQAVFGPVDQTAARSDFTAHYRCNRADTPDEVCMTGVYVSLMSGLIALFGWDLLLTACGTDPQGFGEVANRYAGWMQGYMNALAETDVPCVMIHDDIVWTSGAFIHPDWYRTYLFPHYKRYFRPILDSGKKLIFTSDGDYTAFIDDLADCGVHGFVMEPCTDMQLLAERYGRTHALIGNADTRILLSGTRAEIEAEVRRCMDIGKPCPGFFMAVGNHIPANTPVENCLIYEEAYRKLSRR
jgi:hypothetical protein